MNYTRNLLGAASSSVSWANHDVAHEEFTHMLLMSAHYVEKQGKNHFYSFFQLSGGKCEGLRCSTRGFFFALLPSPVSPFACALRLHRSPENHASNDIIPQVHSIEVITSRMFLNLLLFSLQCDSPLFSPGMEQSASSNKLLLVTDL